MKWVIYILMLLSFLSVRAQTDTGKVKRLDSVVVSSGYSRLRDVEGTAIYAGKKTEVIVLKDLIVNKATNNSRQVYARVAGLNIWENDGAGLQLAIG
ncbi:MAG: hypothetical protein ABUL46_00545, partial [Chitinophaga rupis]